MSPKINYFDLAFKVSCFLHREMVLTPTIVCLGGLYCFEIVSVVSKVDCCILKNGKQIFKKIVNCLQFLKHDERAISTLDHEVELNCGDLYFASQYGRGVSLVAFTECSWMPAPLS